MKTCRFLLALAMLVIPAMSASAGSIFGKRAAKPNPADRVPELIVIVKSSQDEEKRVSAAEELRQYDPAAFPLIVPVLIDVLQTDPKPAVRSEAAQTLGKLRPVSQQAGMALDQAISNDASMRVRLQARSSLLLYHWAGYHSPKTNEAPVFQTKEPPLAPMNTRAPAPIPPVTSTSAKNPILGPPPATSPVIMQPPERVEPAILRPGASSPAGPPLIPVNPPELETPPSSEGPELTPPQ